MSENHHTDIEESRMDGDPFGFLLFKYSNTSSLRLTDKEIQHKRHEGE